MVSPAGGIDIEEVARTTPEKIRRTSIDSRALPAYQARELARFLDERPAVQKQLVPVLRKLVRAYWANDASLAEINPLVVTKQGEVKALDAKVVIDDNALDRHPDVAALRDSTAEDPGEAEARENGLSYVRLDGTIGCVVNGAGLAMATMDIIKLAGGEPANFLDVGGGASAEQIENAFRILISDPHVKAVLINIFGGILRCDRLAEGVIKAVKALGVTLPIVIRMEGTNVELGQQMLRDSGLNFIAAQRMRDAAAKAVQAARAA
jgi:succinyl-CoA synthetase beta subunit